MLLLGCALSAPIDQWSSGGLVPPQIAVTFGQEGGDPARSPTVPLLSKASCATLQAEHATLQAEYAALHAEYATLKAEHATLQAEHAAHQTASHEPAPAEAAPGNRGLLCDIDDFFPLEEHIDGASNVSDIERMVADRLAAMHNAGIKRMITSFHSSLTWVNFSSQEAVTISLNTYNKSDYFHAIKNMRFANEAMLDYAARSSGRFFGLCSVYMGLTEAAINEVQWCHANGMPGIMIYGHQTMENDDGSITYDYYYKRSSLMVWREIARLKMFLYLHPTDLTVGPDGLYQDAAHSKVRTRAPGQAEDEGLIEQVKAYDEGGMDRDGSCTSFDTGAGYGYMIHVAQIVGNLIYHGVFDEVPDLKIVLGHNGESLAFLLWRIDHRASGQEGNCGLPTLKHNFSTYFRRNFYVTTSGFVDTVGLSHLIRALPEDRILFSMDSNPESVKDAVDWYRSIPQTNPEISCDLLQKIAYKNAEALFAASQGTDLSLTSGV